MNTTRPRTIKRVTSFEKRLCLMGLYGMDPESVGASVGCSARTVRRVLHLDSSREDVSSFIIRGLPKGWNVESFFAESEAGSAVAA
jgi:hypothetical protein